MDCRQVERLCVAPAIRGRENDPRRVPRALLIIQPLRGNEIGVELDYEENLIDSVDMMANLI